MRHFGRITNPLKELLYFKGNLNVYPVVVNLSILYCSTLLINVNGANVFD